MEQRLEDRSLMVAKAEDAEKAKDKYLDELRLMWKKDIENACNLLKLANTEVLKLSGNLSVRGMIEKIELQLSDKRRRDGKHASRKAVWNEILENNEGIKQAVIKSCTGRNLPCRIDSAVEAIVQIYQKVSDEIHNAGCDEIIIRRSMFHGVQLEVLRGLCAETHYATREVD